MSDGSRSLMTLVLFRLYTRVCRGPSNDSGSMAPSTSQVIRANW